MSKQTAVPAGDRFANDLRRIREAQGVTIKQIHEETRVALSLVETFERGDLYDHPGFNRVYMRSFIRAYTSCLGVDAEEALRALDDALDGNYDHALADRYLDSEGDGSEGAPEDARREESEEPTASDTAEAEPSVQESDSEPDAPGQTTSPKSRHGRPMGGRAAAGRDLSSVSAPRPVGGGTNGTSAESSSDAGETGADARAEPDESVADRDHSSSSDSPASSESNENSPPLRESTSDDASAAAETGPDASESVAGGAETDTDEPGADEAEASAIEGRAIGERPTAGSGDALVGEPSPASPPADASDDDAPEETDTAESDTKAFDTEASEPADGDEASSPASPDAGDEDREEDDELHPLMRDPSDLDVEEDEQTEGPPDLQPHEDPSSDIAPDAEDLPDDDVPSWMQSGSGEASKGKRAEEREVEAGASADAHDAHDADDADTHTVSAGTIDDTAPLPDRSSADRATETPSVLRTLLRQQTLAVGIGAVVSLLLAGVLLFWGLGGFSESSKSGSGSGETPAALSAGAGSEASADTMEASSADRPPLADVTLGETLHLTIVAETDIAGLRIQRDDDLRRPYWIEAGEAAVFPFERRVIVSDPAEDIDRILVEGYPYPADRTDAQGRLVLTRDSIQSFADTLRGAPDQVAAPSDTIAIPSTSPEPESDGASDEDANGGSSLP